MDFLQNLPLGWIGTIITSAGGAWASWFFTRRKFKAEAQGSELKNIEQAIAIWRKIADDLEVRVDSMQAEMKALRDELAEKNKLERHLRNQIISLRGEVSEFKQQVKEMSIENADLKKELQSWRAANNPANNA